MKTEIEIYKQNIESIKKMNFAKDSISIIAKIANSNPDFFDQIKQSWTTLSNIVEKGGPKRTIQPTIEFLMNVIVETLELNQR